MLKKFLITAGRPSVTSLAPYNDKLPASLALFGAPVIGTDNLIALTALFSKLSIGDSE